MSLIGLRGLVDCEHFTFMLDSGASSNFIPEYLASKFKLKYQN